MVYVGGLGTGLAPLRARERRPLPRASFGTSIFTSRPPPHAVAPASSMSTLAPAAPPSSWAWHVTRVGQVLQSPCGGTPERESARARGMAREREREREREGGKGGWKRGREGEREGEGGRERV